MKIPRLVKRLILSPASLLRLSRKERANVRSVRFVPPRLGCDEHFGRFLVRLRRPRLS